MIKSVKKMNDYESKHCAYQMTDNTDKVYYVPLVEDNTHYQQIQEWVAEGNTIEEAD
tara:strand:- start:715 stop:885 length:171 start_codon:yes stop_codon:yes gene_type:complete